MIHMEFHPFHQPLHDRFHQVCLLKTAQCIVGCHAFHHPGKQRNRRPQKRGMNGQKLHSGICVMRMGIHDPACQFHKLPDMPHQQHAFCLEFHRGIQRFSHKIAAFYRILQTESVSVFFQKINAVISRHHQQILHPVRQLLPDLHPDRIDQSLFTHGFYYPAGAKNRDPAHDPQPWIEGLLCQSFSFRNGDEHLKAAGIPELRTDFQHIFPDHLTGHPIDCGRPNRLFQPRLRDPADPSAAVNADTMVHVTLCTQLFPPHLFCRIFAKRHFCVNPDPAGYIRIITAVLLDRAAHRLLPSYRIQHLKMQRNLFRSHQIHI